MSEIIKTMVAQAQKAIKSLDNEDISDDRAFSNVILRYVYKVDYADHIVTDGKDDGGIDFLYYDDDENKIILGQAKYTGTLTPEDIVREFQKMYGTLTNFRIGRTGAYNGRVRHYLQDMLDRLPDESYDNVEYCLFTTASSDPDAALKKIEKTAPEFPVQAAMVYNGDTIEKVIIKDQEDLNTVKEDKVSIDEAQNYLSYESSDSKGVMCNVSSVSITRLFNRYAEKGLFDLNIRSFIKSKSVDEGIKKTLDKNRQNFWFLNNGIIIACKEFIVDGNTIKLYDFSIVNGGQTTTLIGSYKGTSSQEFFIPCKIVSTKDNKKAPYFFTSIAEASNSQKPIYARDLKSNAPEMVRLANWLKTEKVFLQIKRGVNAESKAYYSIKNDELGQLLLSFVRQRPGTSRSGKKAIFDKSDVYNQLFKVNYDQEKEKKAFLLDLIDLNKRYDAIESNFKNKTNTKKKLSPEQIEILKNGRQAIFALMGMCYRLVNGLISEEDINNSPKNLTDTEFFEYGTILSHYKDDDLDQKLEQVIYDIVVIITSCYSVAFRVGATTSVSNYLKTDSKYYELAKEFLTYFSVGHGEDLQKNWDIFKQ